MRIDATIGPHFGTDTLDRMAQQIAYNTSLPRSAIQVKTTNPHGCVRVYINVRKPSDPLSGGVRWTPPTVGKRFGRVVVGAKQDGSPIVLDFRTPQTRHLLIGSAPRMGKTTLQALIILEALADPMIQNVVILDPESVEDLGRFAGLPRVTYLDEIDAMTEWLLQHEAGRVARPLHKGIRTLIVVDEGHALPPRAQALLEPIARQGGKRGDMLILASQGFTDRNVKLDITNNIPNRVALWCTSLVSGQVLGAKWAKRHNVDASELRSDGGRAVLNVASGPPIYGRLIRPTDQQITEYLTAFGGPATTEPEPAGPADTYFRPSPPHTPQNMGKPRVQERVQEGSGPGSTIEPLSGLEGVGPGSSLPGPRVQEAPATSPVAADWAAPTCPTLGPLAVDVIAQLPAGMVGTGQLRTLLGAARGGSRPNAATTEAAIAWAIAQGAPIKPDPDGFDNRWLITPPSNRLTL